MFIYLFVTSRYYYFLFLQAIELTPNKTSLMPEKNTLSFSINYYHKQTKYHDYNKIIGN